MSASDFLRDAGLNVLGFRMLLSVFLIVSLYLAVSIFGNEDSLYWPDWYILKLDSKADIEEVEKALRDMGVEEVISGVSAKVSYMAIPELESFSVTKLEEYLIPGDPRRDPYISSVTRLFESNGAPLVYIRAERRLFYYKAVLERQERISDWKLMDWRGVRMLINPLLLISVTTLVTLFGSTRNRRPVRFVSVIPLWIFVLLTTPNTVIPLVLAFYLSPNALGARRKPRAHQIIIYFGYASALASIFLTYDEIYLPLLAILVSESVYLILAGTGGRLTAKRDAEKDGKSRRRMALEIRGVPNPEHRLFSPIPLSHKYRASVPGNPQDPVFAASKTGALLLAALVLLIFLIPEPISINHDPLPYARKSTRNFDDIEAMELLSVNRSPSSLPDISLLMASAAYQEGFLFGAVFRLPKMNESLAVKSYRQVGNTMKSVEDTVVEYNQAWYKRQLSVQLGSGVGKLFASLKGPSPVSMITAQPVDGWGWDRYSVAILWSASFLSIFILALISEGVNARERDSIQPSGGG